jgi:hypothetical protein
MHHDHALFIQLEARVREIDGYLRHSSRRRVPGGVPAPSDPPSTASSAGAEAGEWGRGHHGGRRARTVVASAEPSVLALTCLFAPE